MKSLLLPISSSFPMTLISNVLPLTTRINQLVRPLPGSICLFPSFGQVSQPLKPGSFN